MIEQHKTAAGDDVSVVLPDAAPQEPSLRTILRQMPRPPQAEDVAKIAVEQAAKRSEARRDAVVAVAAAIERRGQNTVLGWTVKDIETVYAIAEQLIALDGH